MFPFPGLFFRQFISLFSDSLFHDPDILTHFFKFFRFHGKSTVCTAICPAKSHMLFYHMSTKCNGSGRHNTSHGMIRKTGNTVVGLRHSRNHLQIHRIIRCRISRSTFQQNDLIIAFLQTGLQCQPDILFIGDSGSHDNRFPQFCNLTDHGNIIQFKRCYFIAWNIHLFQKIHCSMIKWRRKECQSHFFRYFFKFWLPLPGGVRCFIQLMQCHAIPQSPLCDLKPGLVTVNGDRICCIGLNLHRIRAGILCCLHNGNSPFKIHVMIC